MKPGTKATVETLGRAKTDLLIALSRGQLRAAEAKTLEGVIARVEALQAKLKARGEEA